MHLPDRVEPRWVALLLVPVLLAAGAAQPEASVPRAAAAVSPLPAVPLLPDSAPEAQPAVAAAALDATAFSAVTARRELQVSRAVPRSTGGRSSLESRGQAALRALAYDAAALGYRVRFLPYRGGELGTTNRRSRLITVYVQRGQSELTLRTTIAHELGHALDFTHGTAQRHDAYRAVRRLRPGPWYPCNRCNDLASPAGDFAEVFAVWLAGPGDFRGLLAGPPTAAQLRELAPLFAVPRPVRARPATAGPSPTPKPSQEQRPTLPALLGPPPSPAPDRR